MKSCIYEGEVFHRRFSPKEHHFRYGIFMMYLDLAELETVFRGRLFWSTSRPALARFRRGDHLGNPEIPLETAVRDLVEEETGKRPAGPIRLLTHLRYFGYVINPVSFFYCFDEQDERVETIVAEVNNTPWGERHCYVIQAEWAKSDRQMTFSNPKQFHVSPFMGMDQQYRWKLTEPDEQLCVSIANFEQGNELFNASLSLRRREITTGQLARVLLQYPLQTVQVVAGIYWQALKLWWKGCPLYPHPKYKMNQKVNG